MEMYDAKSRTTKFAPIFFNLLDEQFVPEPVLGHTQYLLNSEENYAKLYAFLTGRAGVRPGELGSLRTSARNPAEPLRFDNGGPKKPVNLPDISPGISSKAAKPRYLSCDSDAADLRGIPISIFIG